MALSGGPRSGRASRTAEWVALARTVGGLLPHELVLADDPHGVVFAGGRARALADFLLARPRLARWLLPHAGPLTSFLLWMQLRTRALDEVLLEFVAHGGRQIVLLGAGYDCRALRFGGALERATLFEVNHPSTQAEKVERLSPERFRTRVVYVGWDFERDLMESLPARLHAHGLDRAAPVLTIWEGVTMYLSAPAIEATVSAVRAFGAESSRLALTYIDRAALAAPHREHRLSALLAARVGEPWRFGFDPRALGPWLAERGYALESDVCDRDLAVRFYPAHVAARFEKCSRRLAVAALR